MPTQTAVYVGSDSGGTDNPAAPGTICALFVHAGRGPHRKDAY